MKIPDIRKSYCTELYLSGTVNISKSVAESIKNENIDLEKGYYGVKIEKIGENEYALALMVRDNKKSDGDYIACDLMVSLTMRDAIRLKELKDQSGTLKLINLITPEKPNALLKINAEFLYPIDKFKSIIPLPFIPPTSNLKNLEVKGLRINFKEEAVGEYSHIIDLGTKNLYHSITLRKYVINLSVNSLEDMLKLVSNLSIKMLEQKNG